MCLATNIRYLRKKNKYSQEFIAEQLGYKSYTTVQKWEMGISEPSIAKIRLLADLFQVDFNDMTSINLSSLNVETDIPSFTKRDDRDIEKQIEATLLDLENSQEALMFSGEPLDEETKELLKASLENSLRIGKINAKKKFTPKKYRNR